MVRHERQPRRGTTDAVTWNISNGTGNLAALASPRGTGQDGGMTSEPATYPGYRFPAEIIGHALWLYHVFSLSLRDVELILAA